MLVRDKVSKNKYYILRNQGGNAEFYSSLFRLWSGKGLFALVKICNPGMCQSDFIVYYANMQGMRVVLVDM